MSNTNETAGGSKPLISFRAFIITGFVAFVVLFVGIFGWMASAPISGAVIASGSVSVRGKPKLIQHLDGGLVKEILIDNGDAVKKGDILARLDDTLLIANLEIYRNRLREGLARKARLEAERDGGQIVIYDEGLASTVTIGDNSAHRRGQERLFRARLMSKSGQIEQLREKISQFHNQIKGVNGIIKSRTQQTEYVIQELNGIRELYSKGLASQTRVLAQEARRADLEGQLSENQADLSRIDNSIRETEIAILQVEREFQEAVLSELRQVSTEVDELIQQILATTKQLERIEIKAPVNGIVHELNVYTIGGVIAPGGTLMQIIALDEGVELDAKVEPQSIDQLHIGQEALIRLPAFNQRTTPELYGTVKTISASSVIDEKTGIAFYRVEINVPPEEIKKLGELILVPGMPAEAFIVTGARTAFSYIFKPLSDSVRHAFREE